MLWNAASSLSFVKRGAELPCDALMSIAEFEHRHGTVHIEIQAELESCMGARTEPT